MTAVAVPLAASAGAAVAARVLEPAVRRAPAALLRTNVSGRPVPAVLGVPLSAGTLAGLAAAAVVRSSPSGDRRRILAVGAGLCVTMASAGHFDDRRGEEAARGFRGHLVELSRGRLTGGAVKMAAGALGGGVAGRVLADGRAAVEIAALVALGANWVNLLDRAPGRAAKVSIALGGSLLVAGACGWRPAGAAVLGALIPCVGPDLDERAMLGDAGANALGAVLALGLALSLGARGRRVAIAALAALTAASERWSYSRVIERVGVLAWVDGLGRASSPRPRFPGGPAAEPA
jgi:hypothetical protein